MPNASFVECCRNESPYFEFGFSVLAIDYRGFGKSDGQSTFNISDIRATCMSYNQMRMRCE